jgi:hypothetical protein
MMKASSNTSRTHSPTRMQCQPIQQVEVLCIADRVLQSCACTCYLYSIPYRLLLYCLDSLQESPVSVTMHEVMLHG